MGGTEGRFGIFGRVLRSRDMRRLEAAFLGFSFGEQATWLAVLVYALERGGAREVGAVAALQLLPGIALAPFAAYAGDRFPPHRALATGYVIQGLAMAVTAAAMWAGNHVIAYGAAACAATAITFTRPVMGSLLPMITHRPADLVAANVTTGLIEQLGVFIGPLAAGMVMALGSPAAVFGVVAVVMAGSALAVSRLDPVDGWVPGSVGADDVVAQVFAGFSALRNEPQVRVLVWLGACAAFASGVGDVLFVTFAGERLGGGGGQSGLLAAAYGVGALLGAGAVARLVQARRMSRHLLAAGACVSAPLALLAGVGDIWPALAAFAVLGAGATMVQLISWVTIQRRASTTLLSRVFGIAEALRMAAIAIGSVAVSVLVAGTSLDAALVVLAAVMAVMVIGGIVRLQMIGGADPLPDPVIVDRILGDPIFAPLPAPTIERLAVGVEIDDLGPGTTVVIEGEQGDRYYVVVEGTLAVTIAGEHIRFLGVQSSFGEIALLRDVPRTASVTTVTDARLLAVSRDQFLEVVTGHPRSFGTASAVAERFDSG